MKSVAGEDLVLLKVRGFIRCGRLRFLSVEQVVSRFMG